MVGHNNNQAATTFQDHEVRAILQVIGAVMRGNLREAQDVLRSHYGRMVWAKFQRMSARLAARAN